MATKLKPKWKCDHCDELHDYEEDAVDCCAPTISERWVCPECGDDYRTEAEAIECCEHDDDAPPPPPTAEELEAAGQMRLLP